MDVNVIQGGIQDSGADTIIVNLFEGVTQPGGATGAVDQALGGAISDLVAGGDFSGGAGETAVLYPRGAIPARRVIVVGLGKQETLNTEAVRRAAATALKQAHKLKAVRAATVLHGAGAGSLGVEDAAQAVAEGSLLAAYRYAANKRQETQANDTLEALTLTVFSAEDVAAAQAGLEAAQAIAAGVAVTRDLVNAPPNVSTPSYLAAVAEQVGRDVGLRVQALEQGQIEALHMGALLAVAQGSDTPPRFIILEHNADRAADLPSIVLVGKGVTFDTGGYSLKSRDGMGTMKVDMAGAAAVIGAMRAIGQLKPDLHVVGLCPAADNMINGRAYRPQEVYTASNGVTIEINSTDAEGRMLLADALVFAQRFNPVAVVDIATLTGGAMIALGTVAAALFSNNDGLRDALLAAASATEERLWPMPLYEEYKQYLKSEVADTKNSGIKPGGSAGQAAIFLQYFVDYPWAHIDMAGMAADMPDNPYLPGKGASGYGVRVMTEFVRRWQA